MPSRLSVSGSLRARAVDRRYFRRERERGGHGHDGELGKAAGAPAEPDHPGRGAVGHLTGRAPVTPAAGQHREHRRAVPGTPARQAGPDAHDLAAELVPHDRALGMAARAVRSEPQRPQAVTRSSSSPGPGDGSGTATTSYRPSAPTTAARTTPPAGSDLAAAAAERAAARCQAAPTGAGAQLSPCALIASMTGFQCSRVLSRILMSNVVAWRNSSTSTPSGPAV